MSTQVSPSVGLVARSTSCTTSGAALVAFCVYVATPTILLSLGNIALKSSSVRNLSLCDAPIKNKFRISVVYKVTVYFPLCPWRFKSTAVLHHVSYSFGDPN